MNDVTEMTEGDNCVHQTSLCLNCAWAEAEAQLSKGWKLSQVSRTRFPPEEGWLAWATGIESTGRYGHIYRYGESPAAALRALAVRLREARP